MNTELMLQVTAFVWQEADQLDHGEYGPWLQSWTEDGLYIVPIDPETTDFANTLNYAHDAADMRHKRVARLGSGESISTAPVARTVRDVSRFRILSDDGRTVTVRCAQNLREFRKDTLKHYTADVHYELVRQGESFQIRRKVIRLINSTDALQCVGYIL
ncbi:MAG: aromatic-ring-hydroxylating dioxygenase subunit beta [Burkholderiaceae bacterium]|nr:aromatic-ring-hydroxylating dioxygenase subunit beta [Burkholderiaceae bacterium]